MLFSRLKTRSVLFAAMVTMCAVAAHAQATPEAAVKTFLDSFNAGDTAKAATVNSSAGIVIIDEFAPFSWSGPKAFADWSAGYDTNAKKDGITDPKVTLGAPVVKNATAGEAYLIYPAVYTYKQKGVSMREPADMAVALRKEGPAWKIAGWAWTGTVPKAVK